MGAMDPEKSVYNLDISSLPAGSYILRVHSDEEIQYFTEQNKALQKEARQRASKEDLNHRSKQEDILSRIKERLNAN